MSILEDVYFGEYSANEKSFNKGTKSGIYKDVKTGVGYFKENLLGEDLSIFNKMIDDISELGAQMDFESYKDGVKFGIGLMNDFI